MAEGVSNDLFSTDDPVKLFELTEEIATGSYGAVYKVLSPYATQYHC